MKKNKSLTLSIVIPVYNEESHIKDCLDSISNLDESPDEVILVDNNSTDNTLKIAKKYEFVTIVNESKQGVLFARTTGFNLASSDIIGRIDADTRLDAGWSKRVKKVFANKRVAAATGPVYWYDMPLKEKNYFAESIIKGLLYKYDKEYPFLYGSNMAIRSSEWKKISKELCRKKSMHEDMDLAIHLYMNRRHIEFDTLMKAGASSRRYDSKPDDFYKYHEMMNTTFSEHDMNPAGAKVAVAIYTIGYFTLYPLRRAYDDEQKKRSWNRFIKGNKPRKNPNH